MNDPELDRDFLDFTEETEDSTIEEQTAPDDHSFSPEDFEILARKASGFRSDSQQENAREEDTENQNFETKKGLSRPYQKIIVGIFLTSFVVVCLLLLRGSWLKIMNLSQPDSLTKKLTVDPRQQEIERLKAELALIEQNTKPIKHEPIPEPIPQPKPIPEPEPEPELEPEPEPEAKPIPEPEPIDPYEQWELLSQLGTLGSSDIDLETARGRLSQKKVPKKNKEVSPSQIASSSTASNKVATVSLRQNLGLGQTESDSSNFSTDAKNIILNGLGVSQTQRTSKIASSQFKGNDNSKQVPIANGILNTSIVWIDSSNSEDSRGSITLTEPLKYSNGSIALPKNSSLIVEVSDWDDAGFVTLRPIAVITEEDGEFNQFAISENALLIKNEDNQPLTFKTKNERDGSSGIDRLLARVVKSSSIRLPIPREVGSAISRTIAPGGSSTGVKYYFVEAQTPVKIYLNHPLIIENEK
jgi:outer membrane biosynthesis protein TonB